MNTTPNTPVKRTVVKNVRVAMEDYLTSKEIAEHYDYIRPGTVIREAIKAGMPIVKKNRVRLFG